MLIVSLDQYIVIVALPEVGHDLGFSDHRSRARVRWFPQFAEWCARIIREVQEPTRVDARSNRARAARL
jgi:hypothetical protein